VSKVYILDACALIALLSDEDGADKVATAYNEADSNNVKIMMNVVNLLEVYYDFYRAYNKDTADEMIAHVEASKINIVNKIDKILLTEAGRIKAIYKVSLADSIVIAQTIVTDGILLTSDHHELEIIEKNELINLWWFR
jgi:PIN domain nuclease of toxin-antitoxin system